MSQEGNAIEQLEKQLLKNPSKLEKYSLSADKATQRNQLEKIATTPYIGVSNIANIWHGRPLIS